MNFDIRPLTKELDRSGFSCANASLDEWFLNYSWQNQAKSATRTFVAIDEISRRLVAYYACAVTSVQPANLTFLQKFFSPKYPIPAFLLAKLAVDTEYKSRGVGSLLLRHALLNALAVSEKVGLQAIVVDAIDENAANFYRHNGFTSFDEQPMKLFIPMKVVEASIKAML
jgi:GNAT superfamily N-acetyltransferase